MFSITEKSLYVRELDLWIDSMRSRRRSYVSHGHSDHAREHDIIVSTAANAEICRARFGKRAPKAQQTSLLPTKALKPRPLCNYELHEFNEPWEEQNHRLTLFSAGHVLGSAQLLIEGERGSFVYTGDFKLGRTYTCEPAEVKKCDVLLMECTFGRPQYVFPSRDEVEDRIIDFAANALDGGFAPVIYAYSLGKAQEAMAILGKANLPITAHGAVYEMSRVYEKAGVHMPPFSAYDADSYDGTSVLVWPPAAKAVPKAIRNIPTRSAMLTGWAMTKGSEYRYGVDEVIPLSDHADYEQLLRYIELAEPREVLLNHGWKDFVWRLKRMGINASYLEANEQLALF